MKSIKFRVNSVISNRKYWTWLSKATYFCMNKKALVIFSWFFASAFFDKKKKNGYFSLVAYDHQVSFDLIVENCNLSKIYYLKIVGYLNQITFVLFLVANFLSNKIYWLLKFTVYKINKELIDVSVNGYKWTIILIISLLVLFVKYL